MRSIYEAMIEVYGRDEQFDKAIEECSELIKAILKLRVAERRNSRTNRDAVNRETADGQLIIKAMEGIVLKRQEEFIGEWADVSLMLNQLRIMVPGKYQYALEDKLKSASALLKNDHGLVYGEDFEI